MEYGERTVYTEPCPPPPVFDSLQTDALPQPHLPSPLPVLAWLHKPEIHSSTHFFHNLSSVPSNSTHCQKTNHITSKDKFHHTIAWPKILQVLMGPSPYPSLICSPKPPPASSHPPPRLFHGAKSSSTHTFHAAYLFIGCSLPLTLLPPFTYGDLISSLIFSHASPSRN